MISTKSKWSLWVKVPSWKRIFTEATTQHSRTDARFFVDWSPHVEIYYKGIMMLLPLNYWWKGLSAWWSCFFNDRWFDKEHAWCIALNSLAKSERGLTGRRNSNMETFQQYDFILKALFMIIIYQQRFHLPQVAVIKYENNFWPVDFK